ncbi:BTB/POZ domain-containing protein 6-like [Limulus polyphemus]|uniref:BTB/POZ domain-containing protein 6-like n=1 Tax=Limulus polyphemus TaxID=6850 RepID=A0ABM1BQ06_LIMPO|nr:BTB/POZ domain-containing protein 6-like [Limulus polyphemus]XP_013786434.1 BTB/POZ domain-containing protein 6-like [Limulus polyphemus]XP_022254715.1 BTB/POZ domain-containing protein 6-like [Limulus polyphemus]XP_022254716.1 BTB/POZ domain-containing protein 6-like [Limulus polyphemus]XP_022254717.1 BTB/POZ domain-containing protein 6-like [Limulus polyphemus]XP_022254718.1 BTB/POZ domain-containing protein 6-like [Limulus polyphemus]XP_022254719.1 BTB/POZ domain-containing protein 6-li
MQVMSDLSGSPRHAGDRDYPPLPSAPSPGQVLYNSEDHCDVILLVGQGEKCWRFPGHSFILCSASPVFQSLLAREVTNGDSVSILKIEDVEPCIFEILLRYVYRGADEVNLNSDQTTMQLLTASKKYLLQELSTICLKYLCDHVTKENVLGILSYLKRLSGSSGHDEGQNLQNELLNKCVSIIDAHSDYVLLSGAFENLEKEIVMDIVARDTIQVHSELTVFNALMNWACQECKRQKIELTSMNKRAVLGKLLYYVRYLVMSLEEFSLGPAISGALSEEEKNSLTKRLKGDCLCPLPDQLNGRRQTIKRQGSAVAVSTTGSCHLGAAGPSAISQPPCKTKKKKKATQKLVEGLGDFFIYAIQLLD